MRATLTSKGQLTLPAALRRELSLEAGDQLDFLRQPDGRLEVVAIKKAPAKTGSVMDLAGMIGPAPNGRVLTQEQLDDELGQAICDHVLGREEGA